MGRPWATVATAAALAGLIGCGSSNSSPTAPSGGAGTVGATITIGSDGRVSPASVTIRVGQTVMWVNNHTTQRYPQSNPHPSHTDCPAITGGPVPVGQSRTSGALTTTGTCGYHDEYEPDNPALQGTVVVR